MPVTYVVNCSQFTFQSPIYSYCSDGKGGRIVNEPETVNTRDAVELFKYKMQTEEIEKIVLIGPTSYTEGLKNQLSSSLEFSTKPIEIELKEI